MLGLQKTAEMEAAVLFPCFMILLVKKKNKAFFLGQISVLFPAVCIVSPPT